MKFLGIAVKIVNPLWKVILFSKQTKKTLTIHFYNIFSTYYQITPMILVTFYFTLFFYGISNIKMPHTFILSSSFFFIFYRLLFVPLHRNFNVFYNICLKQIFFVPNEINSFERSELKSSMYTGVLHVVFWYLTHRAQRV